MIQNSLLRSLQTLIYLFPFSFIFGNLIINCFILFISILGILLYRKKILIWNDKITLNFIIFFFLLILFSSYLNYFFFKTNADAFKSVLFLRYLLFFVVIKTVIVNKDINLRKYLIFLLGIVSVISIDIIIQFFLGKNLVGFEPVYVDSFSTYYTSVFKNELIAGGYIMIFATLSFFSISLFFENQKKSVLFLIILTIASLILCSLVLAGNRMPTILFMFFLLLSGLLYKNKRNKFFIISSVVLSLIIFVSIALKSELIYKKFRNFYIGIPNPVVVLDEINKNYPELEKYKNSGIQFHQIPELKIKEKYEDKTLKQEYDLLPFYTGHVVIFITSIELFLDKPLLGGGIKSFRNYCVDKIYLPNRVCENHPHNFYLDILNDLGITGLLLLLIPVCRILLSNYKSYKLNLLEKDKISSWIIFSLILAIFIQFFPFKSSGSFFSTFNSAYTFFILGIATGLHEIKIKLLNKQL